MFKTEAVKVVTEGGQGTAETARERDPRDASTSVRSPRLHAELRSGGIHCGRNRAARLMRARGIRARGGAAISRHDAVGSRLPGGAESRRSRNSSGGANQRWAGDITYVWTPEGWLYLAVILDLYSRKLVGWAIGEPVSRELTLRAPAMALETQATVAIFRSIEGFYNSRRRDSYLGHVSPEEFERRRLAT